MKIKIALLPILITVLLAAGCRPFQAAQQERHTITASNNIITEERTLSSFSGIDMRVFGKVMLSQGDKESIVIQGSDNLLPILQTSVRSGTLIIQLPEFFEVTGLDDYDQLTITITVRDLSSVTVSGAASLVIVDLTTPKLSLALNGAGWITVKDLEAESLNILLNGMGWVEVSGVSKRIRIDISGTGSVAAADLQVQTADVNISGMGDATLWVSKEFSGSISGGGNISYYGSPQIEKESSGSGLFKPLGNK